jgi:hypothetical protein
LPRGNCHGVGAAAAAARRVEERGEEQVYMYSKLQGTRQQAEPRAR